MPTELLPCPFCRSTPKVTERPDDREGTSFFAAIACFCSGYSACAHKMAVRPSQSEATAEARRLWNTRAQPIPKGRGSSEVDPNESDPQLLWAEINRLRDRLEFHLERSAQRSQRLLQWAHEELSSAQRLRYFHIVANGTADVMESPSYAQQFYAMKHRAERAEAELQRLRGAD